MKSAFSSFCRDLIIVLLLSACGAPMATPTSPPAAEQRTATVEERPRGPTSFDLIDQAVAERRIDEETALTYKILSLVRHPQLPSEFKGDDLPGTDDVSALADFKSQDPSTLRPETLELLQPIFLRPYDAGSYFYPSEQTSSTHVLSAVVPRAQPALDATRADCDRLRVMDTSNGIFRIYYETDTQQSLAQTVRDALDNQIWDSLTSLMRGERIGPHSDFDDSAQSLCGSPVEQEKYDIFITSSLASDGQTFPEDQRGRNAFTSYILIAAHNTPEEAKSVTVHEVMHAFQFTYDSMNDWAEYHWLMEATATWAEWYVYPEISRSIRHSIASTFLNPEASGLGSINEVPLDDTSSDHEYGAYLWPFFLSQTNPEGAGMVPRIWESTETMGGLQAVNSAIPGGFAEQFKEFTLQNYNQRPADLYLRADGMGEKVGDFVDAQFFQVRPELIPVRLEDLPVAALAAGYYAITPIDELRYMNFRLDAINARPGAALKAIVTRVGESTGRIEDWSELSEREFCRDKPTENVEEIILILSNSNWETFEPLNGSDIEVEITSSPCFPSGAGTVWQRITTDVVEPDGSREEHTIAELSADFTATYVDDPSLSQPGVVLQFTVTGSMTVSFQSSYRSDLGTGHAVAPPCTVTLAAEGGQVILLYPDPIGMIPKPLIAFAIGGTAEVPTCSMTTTDTSFITGETTTLTHDVAAGSLFPGGASTSLIPDQGPSGLPLGGVFADIFTNDLAGFEDFKTLTDLDGTVTTIETRFNFRLPEGQRLN